jgi:hypothetical protein
MPKPPNDLFGGAPLSINPDSTRSEPRLWVRRLAIWKEPSTEPIRDFSFRPGLNIVWSLSVRETIGDGEGAIGHGSGKTLLCRLIRYCLGERRFAPEDQRTAIGAQFLEGLVGAEILLDGVCWAILRPLGHRQKHVAIPGGSLDALASGEGGHTGMEPFVSAVEAAFFTPQSIDLVPGRHAWLTELAWLTRDQECGFDRVLEWRDPSTGSESPARNLATEDAKLFSLRVFLKAMTPEERALGEEIRDMDLDRERRRQESVFREREVEETRRKLISKFHLSESDLADELQVAALKKAARHRLAEVARITTESQLTDPEPLRDELSRARAKLGAVREHLAGLRARIDEKKGTVDRMKKEVVALALSTDEEENPPCPICEVPIDRVLATKCNLSHKLIDLETIRQKRESHRIELENQVAALKTLNEDLTQMGTQQEAATGEVGRLEAQLRAIEKANDSQTDAWYGARRAVDDVARYEQLLNARAGDKASFETLVGSLEGKREQMGAFRERQKQLFTTISGIFNYIVQQLVGSVATGSVRLTGNGLEPKIQMGGDRETPGTKCIKVLAFDLTALCLSTEKGAQIAPLFIHDSPREADLDIEVYHRHFDLVRDLETRFGAPLFQYIITTTTPPPKDLQGEEWTRGKLKGAPAGERLLRCDL